MAERADQSGARAHRDALVLAERDSRRESGDGVADRDGVVDGTERVDTDVKTEVDHLLSHVVRKAAAENEQLVIQGDAYLASARFDGSL